MQRKGRNPGTDADDARKVHKHVRNEQGSVYFCTLHFFMHPGSFSRHWRTGWTKKKLAPFLSAS